MAIESRNGGISITGEKDVLFFRHMTLARGLAMEITTGMKMSRGVSAVKIAQQDGLTTKRTKKGALQDVVNYLRETRGYEPTGSVLKALNS